MSSSNFDAEILAAQQAKSALLKKIAVYAGSAIVGVAVIYVGVSLLTDTGFSPGESSPTQVQVESATIEAPDDSEDILTISRTALQQKLVNAENAVVEIEQDEGRKNFNISAIKSLRNILQLALGSYASENYQQTDRQLTQLQAAMVKFEQNYAKQWQLAWQQAQNAFDKAQHSSDPQALTQARLQNQRVLHLYPDYSPARDMRARLDVWQEVQQYLEQLRVAEVENNLHKQLSLSEQILALDPNNQEVTDKADLVRDKLREQSFADAIVSARTAVDDKDIPAAQSALQKARTIDAKRPEVVQIQQQLQEMIENNSVAHFEQQISTMQSVDNWAAAQRLSTAAKAKHPNHANFELSLQLANQILAYQRQLDVYLAAPERLTDNNIHSNAQRLLAEIAPVEVASVGLKKTADVLRAALENSQQTMAVTVLSDGRTDIRILGTGVVGKTREKVIQLLPGNYRFEGRRDGYQSKILSFTVKATDEIQSVTLVCDQKI